MNGLATRPVGGRARTPGQRARRRWLGAVVTVLLACSAVPGFGSAAAAANHRASSDLLIDAQEWSLWTSRTKVPAGTIFVQLWNRGQDAHDTWIRRLNREGQMVGPVLGRVPMTLPGHIGDATWHLRPGSYELFCSMPGHIQMGMHARLRAVRA